MTTAPGIGCVDGHDIEISRAVEDAGSHRPVQNSRRKMIYCTLPCGEPIRITDDGRSNKIACQKIGLVSGLAGFEDRESVRY